MSEENYFTQLGHGWKTLKVAMSDSEGFAQVEDLNGDKAYIMEVTKQDREQGYANIILWHLTKARDEICSTADNPRNDTRVLLDKDGFKVKQAIQKVIDLYKENFRVGKPTKDE